MWRKSPQYCLIRGGGRDANNVLWIIAMVRLQSEPGA
jgi:hypothetical protein